MLTKTDCFAYITKGNKPGCNALTTSDARCEGCAFYKTVEENQRQAEAAKARLDKLGSREVKEQRKRGDKNG